MLVYLMADNANNILSIPVDELYLYLGPDDSIMNGEMFYDCLPFLDSTYTIFGQFSDMYETLLAQIEIEYGIKPVGSQQMVKTDEAGREKISTLIYSLDVIKKMPILGNESVVKLKKLIKTK
jgi:cyclophilin family peptidyl-prolyl cis-trans isomerase